MLLYNSVIIKLQETELKDFSLPIEFNREYS